MDANEHECSLIIQPRITQISRIWGAHAARVLAKASRLRGLSINESS